MLAVDEAERERERERYLLLRLALKHQEKLFLYPFLAVRYVMPGSRLRVIKSLCEKQHTHTYTHTTYEHINISLQFERPGTQGKKGRPESRCSEIIG